MVQYSLLSTDKPIKLGPIFMKQLVSVSKKLIKSIPYFLGRLSAVQVNVYN